MLQHAITVSDILKVGGVAGIVLVVFVAIVALINVLGSEWDH